MVRTENKLRIERSEGLVVRVVRELPVLPVDSWAVFYADGLPEPYLTGQATDKYIQECDRRGIVPDSHIVFDYYPALSIFQPSHEKPESCIISERAEASMVPRLIRGGRKHRIFVCSDSSEENYAREGFKKFRDYMLPLLVKGGYKLRHGDFVFGKKGVEGAEGAYKNDGGMTIRTEEEGGVVLELDLPNGPSATGLKKVVYWTEKTKSAKN